MIIEIEVYEIFKWYISIKCIYLIPYLKFSSIWWHWLFWTSIKRNDAKNLYNLLSHVFKSRAWATLVLILVEISQVTKLAPFMNLKADIRQFDLSRLNAMDRLEKCFPSVWRKWLWNSCCSHKAIRVSSILNNPSATFWNEIKPIKISILEFVHTQLTLTRGP